MSENIQGAGFTLSVSIVRSLGDDPRLQNTVRLDDCAHLYQSVYTPNGKHPWRAWLAKRSACRGAIAERADD